MRPECQGVQKLQLFEIQRHPDGRKPISPQFFRKKMEGGGGGQKQWIALQYGLTVGIAFVH